MSHLLYRGPSMLGNMGEIMAVMTGQDKPSSNIQTGRMLTIWFMPTSMLPELAVKTGDDELVCGDCKMRPMAGGHARCYVRHSHGSRQVWNGMTRRLAETEPLDVETAMEQIRGTRLGLRLGGWGDPASVNSHLLLSWISAARYHTGYTQQWRTRPELARWIMASVSTEAEAIEAQDMGFKTYRIIKGEGGPKKELGEKWCPTVIDGTTPCQLCKGCNGYSKSYCTPVHGFGLSKLTSYNKIKKVVNQ